VLFRSSSASAEAYPNVNDEDIRACLSYASALADEEAGVTA